MNQEQVVERLLELENSIEDFTVIFTGKRSRKVDGLYKPEKRQIIIHNKNFNNDNALVYTAIHEFAHHIQFTRSSGPVSVRAHTSQFWSLFHRLLFIAEEKGIFINLFKKERRFLELTKRFKEQFLSANGRLMIEFGKLLMEAYELCSQYGVSFEDYVDRELQLHRSTAKTLIKLSGLNINPEIGYENMKILARIGDPEEREHAEAAFSDGESPDMVKAAFSNRSPNKYDHLEDLLLIKEQIERKIERLTVDLADVKKRIEEFHS